MGVKVKMKKKSTNQITIFFKNNYYFLIVIVVLILTIIGVNYAENKIQNSPNDYEQKVYNIIKENEDTFRNATTIQVVNAKICSNDYAIIRISGQNAYGAIISNTMFYNQGTLTMYEDVATAVSKKCFEEEFNNYDNVVILSNSSISKVNMLLKGEAE